MAKQVYAIEVDYKYIYYECSTCWTIQGGRVIRSCFKGKQGDFFKSARPTIHKHGSDGIYDNRVVSRGNHCKYNNEDVEIVINDETIKPVLPILFEKNEKDKTIQAKDDAWIVSFD